jgi:hypothetical protein
MLHGAEFSPTACVAIDAGCPAGDIWKASNGGAVDGVFIAAHTAPIVGGNTMFAVSPYPNVLRRWTCRSTYWITSSVRSSTDRGIVSPKASGVLRLITVSNSVG